jgi:hypothetical protein
MKNLIVVTLALLLITCKKKEDPAPEPTPPAPVVYQMSVKINGTLFQCNTCYSGYKSGGGTYGVNFHFPSSADALMFSFFEFPAPGTYQFKKSSNPSFIYQKSNVYYKAVAGELKINSIDTSASGVINKLNCTFSCQTDTTGSTFFSFTEGTTNL